MGAGAGAATTASGGGAATALPVSRVRLPVARRRPRVRSAALRPGANYLRAVPRRLALGLPDDIANQAPPAAATTSAAMTPGMTGGLLAALAGLGGFEAREIRARLLERALDVFDFVAAQGGLDEQAHARRRNRTMQEAIHHARGDLRGDLGLFFRGADHHQHEIGPGVAQALGHRSEVALDEHAVEQRDRDAAAVQMRREFGFGADEDEIVGRIDDAAQESDQRAVLRNRGDRHRRRGTGEHGRFEFRLRQHDGGGRPAKSSENKGCEGTLTRYVSLSGKAAPRPCAPVIRELRPATNVW